MATRKPSLKDNGKNNKEEDALCGKCEKKCEALSLTCDMCGLWHHIKCEGVSEKSYKLIGEGEIHGLRWFCKKCDQYAANIMTNIKKLTSRLDSLEERTESRVGRVEERVARVEESEKGQSNRVKGAIERIDGIEVVLRDDPREVTDEDIKTQIQQTTSSFLKEKEEKETRKMNVIVNNVPESEGETAKERKGKDKQRCLEQFEKIVEISETDIESIVRLGATTGDRPRPIKIKMKCETMRNELIRNARQINEGVEAKARIYINKDETREERLRGKELREERRQRLSQGETDLIIDYREGRVIKKSDTGEGERKPEEWN